MEIDKKLKTEKERRLRIYELNQELAELRNEEVNRAIEKEKERKYKAFLRRDSDWIIGKAHGETKVRQELGAYYVHIFGNQGTTYFPKAHITDVVHTYFHNVWDENQKYQFQNKLNDLIHEEINNIINTPEVVIELMELAEIFNFSRFPKDKIKLVKESFDQERTNILDKFEIGRLMNLFGHITHGKYILKTYLKGKFDKLPTDQMKCYRCKGPIKPLNWINEQVCSKCEYKQLMEEDE